MFRRNESETVSFFKVDFSELSKSTAAAVLCAYFVASCWHVAIERLARHAELGAKLANICPRLSHGGLSESQLRRCHLERPSTVATASAGRRETRSGPLR
jgi:hypothetical protein